MHGGGERWAMALGIGMPFDSRVGSQEPLVISTSADINGSVTTDTIVQNNCSLHVRGNLIGNLTIDPGAEVVVDGSVDGKIVNRGGRLVVNHKGLAAFVTLNGPSENEAGATLRINLTAIASNWVRLAKSTVAECAAVVCNAYGCGIASIVKTLVQFGCHTFFVRSFRGETCPRGCSSFDNLRSTWVLLWNGSCFRGDRCATGHQ
jgi:hypothetical protein